MVQGEGGADQRWWPVPCTGEVAQANRWQLQRNAVRRGPERLVAILRLGPPQGEFDELPGDRRGSFAGRHGSERRPHEGGCRKPGTCNPSHDETSCRITEGRVCLPVSSMIFARAAGSRQPFFPVVRQERI